MKIIFTMLFLASVALAQDEAAVSRATAACGPAEARFTIKIETTKHPVAEAAPGKALVYVIEDQKSQFLRDVTTRLGLDGAWLGVNRGNSYFFFALDPGEHHLCADWQSTFLPEGRLVSVTNFTAEAGRVYYFRARTTGMFRSNGETNQLPSLDLEPVSGDEGRLLVASSAFSDSRPKK